ncbi:uncharacterized protein LOC144087178 [Stigmatopora argus]
MRSLVGFWEGSGGRNICWEQDPGFFRLLLFLEPFSHAYAVTHGTSCYNTQRKEQHLGTAGDSELDKSPGRRGNASDQPFHRGIRWKSCRRLPTTESRCPTLLLLSSAPDY